MTSPPFSTVAPRQALPEDRAPLKIVFVGHVDHGKSTVIGRLLHDTGSLPPGKEPEIRAQCDRRGMPFEWSFLLDALQAERDQGITIDTTQIWFKTPKRRYVIIDAPGHKEFLKNMVTGAAAADAAVLVVDAAEGLREQTRRHAYLLHLLGVRQVAVVVNKMDLAGRAEARFAELSRELGAYLAEIGTLPQAVIPIVAREGENLAQGAGATMPWYRGATLTDALDGFAAVTAAENQPLRFPIQDVYKFDERRILAGRIESGRLAVGDRLLFSPANTTARVKSIETWSAAPRISAGAGESVGITLDEPLFLERGDWASHEDDPPLETDVLRATLFWLGREPLRRGKSLQLKLATTSLRASIQSVECIIDTSDLAQRTSETVQRNEVAEVTLRLARVIAVDEFNRLPRTGRFVLVDGYDIAGGGIVSMEGYADQRGLITRRATNIQRVEHRISLEARETRNGHRGGVIWLTGLSGAGKSTLAVELERRLFVEGYQVYVLDGDNVRHGLNADLSFSPEDRAENIRRVGEVAALMARAGLVVVTAFISPYRSDRDRAREAAGARFHEIYVKADVATCEARDPKGLYKKARAGQIADFTGVSAPYEEPEKAELVVDTRALDVEASIAAMLGYVRPRFEV